MASPATGAYKEFKVVFDGIDLPGDVVDRIDQAIQKAVQNELARTEIGVEYAERPLGDDPGEQEAATSSALMGRYYVPIER